MMTTLQILFWLSLFLVFYTHLGYGILLYMLVNLSGDSSPRTRDCRT